MPNLMTMPTNIVFPRVISLRATHRVNIEPDVICSSSEQNIRKGLGKFKSVSIIIINKLVEHHMNNRKAYCSASPYKEKGFVYGMTAHMYPLE